MSHDISLNIPIYYIGPISKSTFEVHTEVLLNASRHADFDHMRGVSANVMMGQMGVFGTGSFQVVLDMDLLGNLDELNELVCVHIPIHNGVSD